MQKDGAGWPGYWTLHRTLRFADCGLRYSQCQYPWRRLRVGNEDDRARHPKAAEVYAVAPNQETEYSRELKRYCIAVLAARSWQV